ncbi:MULTISPECIES: NAD-dependent epimerase/dehydratase family protein [unclassified Janthinobacterium]|uniref:NAD-dependent epimerase/dehydratase family protein n=1 Tax=unclassified Janthinobacterium TaxID=2610881 RepID=UPI00034C0587|nr:MULTISPECIES: NAD-dependent epimerase/dehydratase family protein [unclassified Janthinobacterium]MEC5159022.1 nucleoside-diphosphate-sugar epimerase [Janthinobacterium sp. CG_S6]
MRILLTGASGFIGRHLRAALLTAGHTLVLTARGAAAHAPEPGLRYIEADFSRDVERRYGARAWRGSTP